MSTQGRKWFNNGIEQKMFELGKEPEGWNRGRLSEPWNKNKTGVYSQETLEKMSKAKEGFIPIIAWKKGHKPWNKGLDSTNDYRVKSLADKRRGQKRPDGNYRVVEGKWVGDDNPWFGKDRSGENSPRYNPGLHSREYKTYFNKVKYFTEKNYKEHEDIINPGGLSRAINGTEGGYQLDHIYPISVGYKNNIAPEVIGGINNLRLISWEENRRKWDKIEYEILMENL